MTIPSSGTFSLGNVNTEVGRASGAANSLNDAATRLLTCNPARFLAFNTGWSMSELRGRTGGAFNAYMKQQDANTIAAVSGDGVNPTPLGTIPGGVTVRQIGHVRMAGPSGTIPGFQVVMNCPTPYNRFYAVGIWHGANYAGLFTYANADNFVDGYAFDGAIRVGWLRGYEYGPDVRLYLNQTLTFVFVN